MLCDTAAKLFTPATCYRQTVETKLYEPLISENAVRVRMAESSLSMDPSLPLQEDSLMMPPPVPNRSVSSDLLEKI